MPIIATAAWSVPKTVAARFAGEGSSLARYASVFRGVEVNSTFYRRHKPSTFARWAEAVPADFRFAVKLPQEISHVLRMSGIEAAFATFLDDVAPLGAKLGPLLCQLPPSLAFDRAVFDQAFSVLRHDYSGQIVIEPRHKSWQADAVLDCLDHHQIGRVLADPAPVWPAERFSAPPAYVRLHGAPKIYYSRYTMDEIRDFAAMLSAESWCVFDNTASGAAIENALEMQDLCAGR